MFEKNNKSTDSENKKSSVLLGKLSTLLIVPIFLASCGGGSSHHDKSVTSSSLYSMSSSSVISIQPPVSYKVSGGCAEGSPYSLTITGGNLVSADHLEKMICNFFSTYPKIVALLNPNASKDVKFSFDPNSPYVAAAYGTTVVYLTSYLREVPKDTDIVVHETTHVVQAELVPKLPSWIIEGTADFVRDLYGVDNKNDGWSIPSRYVDRKKHYTVGYGDAAAFFKWIDAVYRQNELPVAAAISLSTLTKDYTDEIWVDLTGKKLDVLWYEYMNFPVTAPFTTGVSVFNGENFTGHEVKLERGNYDLQDLLSLGVTDNQIASIKVPEGYKLKAYVDVNFAGEQMVYTSDTPVIDESMAQKISSIVIE